MFACQRLEEGLRGRVGDRVNFAPGAGVPVAVARHIRPEYAPHPAAGDYAPSIKIPPAAKREKSLTHFAYEGAP